MMMMTRMMRRNTRKGNSGGELLLGLLLVGFLLSGWFMSMAVAAGEQQQGEDAVVELTQDNFHNYINKEKLMLVEFYAPWCGHCKRLAPEYSKAARELEGVVKLAKVDCTAHEGICSQYEVRGYPTMKIFRNKVPQDYMGERSASAIVDQMKMEALPPVTVVTKSQQVDEMTKTHRLIALGFFGNEKAREYQIFEQLAEKLRPEFRFAAIFDNTLMSKFNVTKAPHILLLKNFDERVNSFSSKSFSDETVESFLKLHSMPLMDEIGPENFMKYRQSPLPLAYLFVETEGQRAELGPIIEGISREFKGRMNFVYINASKFGPHANNLNIKQEWPAFGIHDQTTNAKYPLSPRPLTKKNLHSLVVSVLEGKAKPFLKSQPVPESNDGPVKLIVGKEFDRLVMDRDKDVLVEFYAPWCGHCKKMAPTYERLGELFASNKKVVIAKMDATENDLPLDANVNIEGFPTVILFKANAQNEQVPYKGDRSLKDLANFVKQNAVNQISQEFENLKDEL
jgi:protein disulfide-isomerase A1